VLHAVRAAAASGAAPGVILLQEMALGGKGVRPKLDDLLEPLAALTGGAWLPVRQFTEPEPDALLLYNSAVYQSAEQLLATALREEVGGQVKGVADVPVQTRRLIQSYEGRWAGAQLGVVGRPELQLLLLSYHGSFKDPATKRALPPHVREALAQDWVLEVGKAATAARLRGLGTGVAQGELKGVPALVAGDWNASAPLAFGRWKQSRWVHRGRAWTWECTVPTRLDQARGTVRFPDGDWHKEVIDYAVAVNPDPPAQHALSAQLEVVAARALAHPAGLRRQGMFDYDPFLCEFTLTAAGRAPAALAAAAAAAAADEPIAARTRARAGWFSFGWLLG
jgi:hypothetical protein